MKTCTKCLLVRASNDFYSYDKRCKGCIKEYTRARHAGLSKEARDSYNLNRRKARKEWNEAKLSKKRQQDRASIAKRKASMSEEELSTHREYKRERYILKHAGLFRGGKTAQAEVRNSRLREKYRTDMSFKIRAILRARLNEALKNNQKTGSAVGDLGCSVEELKQRLESKFQPGMSWNNQGKWHIDHIIPLSSFNLSCKKELKKACHYTNLQPLWAEDNLRKGDKC